MTSIYHASKRLAHCLRHNPSQYGIELDANGWADLMAIQNATFVSDALLQDILAHQDKPRFEIDATHNRIRATHGHTVPVAPPNAPTTPPRILYHTTTRNALSVIRREGLRPMSRQYVHLHEQRSVADTAGLRHASSNNDIVTLIVNTHAAQICDNIDFYPAQGGVWLVGHIPQTHLWVSLTSSEKEAACQTSTTRRS